MLRKVVDLVLPFRFDSILELLLSLCLLLLQEVSATWKPYQDLKDGYLDVTPEFAYVRAYG